MPVVLNGRDHFSPGHFLVWESSVELIPKQTKQFVASTLDVDKSSRLEPIRAASHSKPGLKILLSSRGGSRAALSGSGGKNSVREWRADVKLNTKQWQIDTDSALGAKPPHRHRHRHAILDLINDLDVEWSKIICTPGRSTGQTVSPDIAGEGDPRAAPDYEQDSRGYDKYLGVVFFRDNLGTVLEFPRCGRLCNTRLLFVLQSEGENIYKETAWSVVHNVRWWNKVNLK